MAFYQAEVKGVFLSAHSAGELADAVADVKAGVPLLAAKMRTADGRAIRRVERDFPWSKLVYA